MSRSKRPRARACACSAASASRSIRKRGDSATSVARSSIPGGRPRPAASDYTAAGCDQVQSGFGDAAVLRVVPENSSMPTARCWRAKRAAISASRAPGRDRCARSMAIHARFEQTYFSTYKGKYFTGGCRDADGYYGITGRVDDVIGHRPSHRHRRSRKFAGGA